MSIPAALTIAGVKVPTAAVAGSVGVAGLALWKRHQKGGKATSGAAQVATADTSSSDLYNALQPQLEQILEAIQAGDPYAAIGNYDPYAGGGSSGSFPDPAPGSSTSPPFPSPSPAQNVSSNYGNPTGPTYTIQPIDPSAPLYAPTAQDLASYGGGFTNTYEGTGEAWAPHAGAGSITAPEGGVLSNGVFQGDVLVRGTYRLPNGTFQDVGSFPS